MRAVRLTRWQSEPELDDVDVPEPGPGEVLVKVDAAGLCHSDLHVMEWPPGRLPWQLPFTLGHETAGTVAAAGRGVSAVVDGDRVLIYGPWGCGTCWQCLRGAENLCDRQNELPGKGLGLGFDGGLAEYALVPSARFLVPTFELNSAQAAPLTDAALSPYHALKPHLGLLRPGAAAVVIGVGGLGHVAVELLRALSPAQIVAVDLRERARRLALAAGAHVALDGDGLEAADVRAELDAAGAALVMDFVANDATLELAAGVLGTGGHCSIVGTGGGTFPLRLGSVPFDASASKPSWGTLPELHEVVALARAGEIEIEVEQIALDDAVEGYRRLRDGEVVGRAVVVP
jgi:alcohol dehydrogenase, propanol-preferring